jgi:hypothetical protein
MAEGALFRSDSWNEHPLVFAESPLEKTIYPVPPAKSVHDPDIPEVYRADFNEAAAVLPVSPKASAAISRRILQTVLRDKFNLPDRDLIDQIKGFVAGPAVPTHLANAVDAVRNVGNIAAHPLKNTSTGTVVDVEPGEAEWLLEVLESLFDFAFVQPKRLENRRNQLNAKLKSIGKPPMI